MTSSGGRPTPWGQQCVDLAAVVGLMVERREEDVAGARLLQTRGMIRW
jgi:hypothetical protein